MGKSDNQARIDRENRLLKFIKILESHMPLQNIEAFLREVLLIGLSADRAKVFHEALSVLCPRPESPPLPQDGRWKNKGTRSW